MSWLCSLISLILSHCPPLPRRKHPKTFSVPCLGTSLGQIAVQGMGLEDWRKESLGVVVMLLQAGAAKLLAAITDIYVDIDVPVLPPSPQSNPFFFCPHNLSPFATTNGESWERRSWNEVVFNALVSSSPACSVIVQAGIGGLITCRALLISPGYSGNRENAHETIKAEKR